MNASICEYQLQFTETLYDICVYYTKFKIRMIIKYTFGTSTLPCAVQEPLIDLMIVVLQHTAIHCCNTLQHTATHCNTLQHAATHCNTLQHTATLCNTLQHPAKDCSTATHCSTIKLLKFEIQAILINNTHTHTHTNYTATHCNTLQHTAIHCNALQCTAMHCDTGSALDFGYLMKNLILVF